MTDDYLITLFSAEEARRNRVIFSFTDEPIDCLQPVLWATLWTLANYGPRAKIDETPV